MRSIKIILVSSLIALLSATRGIAQETAKPVVGSPSTAAPPAATQGNPFEPGRIIEFMRRVADFGLANKLKNRMDMNKDADWSTGTFRAGVMALYRVSKDEKYLKNTVAWGEANQWRLRGNGGGDDSCAGQTYCEMYLLDPKPENAIRYKHTQECFDKMLFDKNFNGFRAWSWQDSLFMGTPVVSMLGKITGKREYYDRLVTGLNDAAEHLYNREFHLWYFRPSLKTTRQGHPQFWGPGNAWVLGALTRDLIYMPQDCPRRGELMTYYKDLCAALVSKQQPDGFWRTSLFEPTEFPDPESSCTAFFIYGMGKGILEGWLDEKTYLPVVSKGWEASITTVDAQGKVGRGQPWSNQPGRVGAMNSIPEGFGAFLLAAEVMHELAEKGRFTGDSQASGTSAAAAPAAIGRRFACTDYTGGKVFIVAADGRIEWEYPAATCNDIWALPNGNLLFNDGKSVKEVSRDKKIAWSFEGQANIYACQRLANGNTFVAECETGRLLEIEPGGKIAKEVRLLPAGKDGGGAFMRNARRLDNGHYLVAHYVDQIVKEYDGDGKVVWSVPAEGGPHSVVRLANGNTLIACADKGRAGRVLEVDPQGKTVWQIAGDELPGISLKFATGLERLANGNTVITNWQGHGKLGQTEDIAEVTPDKKVVWTFSDHARMKTVSSIILLDAEGQH